jgi:hypothetical protein
MVIRDKLTLFWKQLKHLYTLCGQSAEFPNVREGGTNHCFLMD